ncbi:hypothetical protein CBF30_10790 [Vagococcus entomophilus]|uniref:Uncharacterized protein n=1 Tax=Vagococcus entomophilus TaxID=1160095 RepID=A0A430AF32_9ENTE|nr:hypothetical protein CBF30_10790 [Vagococcus entomophilus]
MTLDYVLQTLKKIRHSYSRIRLIHTLGFSVYAVSMVTLMKVDRNFISEIREETLETFLISLDF